eukprot:jgi/Chrzof1/14488/Cz09g04190.t1
MPCFVVVPGGNWEGKKVVFDHATDDGSPPCAASDPMMQGNGQGVGSREVASGDSTADEAGAASSQQGVPTHNTPNKLKWVKPALLLVKSAPGGKLKWRKLWSRLWAQVKGEHPGLGGAEEACKTKCCRRLQSSSKLVFKGNWVHLA